MNKTKKYTIIFVVVCFLIIGGFSLYHALFAAPTQTNAVALNENQTQQQEEASQKEDSIENQSSKVNQSTDDTDTEDNSTTQKQNQQSSQTSSTKQSSSQQPSSSQSQSTSTNETQKTQEVEEEEVEEPTDEMVESVYVTITGVDGVIASDYVEFDEGMSAYDALKVLTDNYEISLKSSGLGQTVYVKAINGLSEFDYGGRSGWKYRVNGTYPSVGAGAYTLKNGDQLEWIYSQNG